MKNGSKAHRMGNEIGMSRSNIPNEKWIEEQGVSNEIGMSKSNIPNEKWIERARNE